MDMSPGAYHADPPATSPHPAEPDAYFEATKPRAFTARRQIFPWLSA